MNLLITFDVVSFLLINGYVCGELAKPQNVTLETLNTNYVLKWDWDQQTAGPQHLTFTAQYLAKFKIRRQSRRLDWRTVCANVSERRCDFTSAGLHYLGQWVLRVMASSEQHNSSWVQQDFCPDKDAVLGPPTTVVLTPGNGLLEVTITDPMGSNNVSMKEYIPTLSYLVQFWKQLPQTQEPQVVNTKTNRVALSDLESWTWYCVKVQSRYDFYNKNSTFSPTQCTKTHGGTSYWQIMLYFLLSMVLCFLLVLLLSVGSYKSYKVIKGTFFPSIQLPAYIQEYLYDSPGSDMPRLLTQGSEMDLVCDRLSVLTAEKVVTETVVLEVHATPEGSALLLEEEAGRHSRHDSGDSGMYSTEEGSATKQQNSTPPPRQEFLDSFPEKMRMVKMGRGFRSGGEEQDEGLEDMCV